VTTLFEALEVTSWRRLRAMGRRRGLPLSSNMRKADLVQRLAQALLDPINLEVALSGLSESEQQALNDLLAGGGRLPLRYMRPRHGDLRSTGKVLQRDNASLSPLESLRRQGIIFYDRATHDVFVPTDIIPHLPMPAQPARPGPPAAAGDYEPAMVATHDLACLLALLQVNAVRPLHARWLPPRLLAEWGRRCARPPASPQARGELRTGRRRFLHYLAEAAGLLGLAGPFLTPTPAAWAWLDSSPDERLNALWRACVTPDPAVWRAYRLPGHNLTPHPDKLIAAVVQALPTLDPSDPLAFAAALLARQPALRDLLPANFFYADAELTAAIADLLTGPLVWLGGVRMEDWKDGRLEDWKTGRMVGWLESNPPNPPIHQPTSSPVYQPTNPSNYQSTSLPTFQSSNHPTLQPSNPVLHLTAWGAAWLGLAPPPEVPPAPRFALTSVNPHDERQGALIFSLSSALPDPAHLMVLMEVGSREYGVGSKEEGSHDLQESARSHLPTSYFLLPTSYRVTAASFARALHGGWSPPALLDALNELAGRPLTGQETVMVRAWAEAAERVTIRRLTLLETSDPQVIDRLAASRRGRSLIVRTLSPRAVVVDEARLDQLVRRLVQQEGVGPEVGSRGVGSRGVGSKGVGSREYGREAGSKGDTSTPYSLLPTPYSLLPTPGPSGAAHIWLALKVYQGLGQYVRLPARTPQALLEHLAQADPDALAAAETAAEAVLAAIQDAVAGRAPFPPWPEDGLPVEESLAVIQAALAEGRALEMDYYTAGRDVLTHRVVEPYRLEQRGEVPYLVGFCRLAQAERVFRVDRIRRIKIAEPDEN